MTARSLIVLALVSFALNGCGSSPPSSSSDDDVLAVEGEDDTSGAEAPPEEVAEPAPAEEPSLVGTWSADARCVPEMRGMDGADQATLDSVSAQLAQNTYVYTDETFEHRNPAFPAPMVQRYRVLSHEGASWSYQIPGPTGHPMQVDARLVDGQLRLSRDGALELCLVRAEP